ncbi:MAG: hypothetical protein HY279_14190 [Nitrospinae bacterium]|nr:hypothetical protein [Nitrospinota bacterium]
MKKKHTSDMPHTPTAWLSEIAEAYYDAYEAMPFGAFVGQNITEKDLFHMTPHICLKFRRIKRTKADVDKTTEAMLSSYVATKDRSKDIFINPHIVFAFAYLACHFALGLLIENKVSEIMEYLEGHQRELKEAIERKIKENCI